MSAWTIEAALSLAPDAESQKAGQKLASSSAWGNMGSCERAIWGECQGSGSKPYQTQVDLSGTAFKCSCPSRKFPCKHALGLLIRFASKPVDFPPGEPVEWVRAWLDNRDKRSQRSEETRESKPKTEKDPAQTAKRELQRQQRVQDGLAALRVWVHDLIRKGLTSAQTQPYAFWESQAARLVDAQAPGLANAVRDMAGIVHSGTDWPSRLLERLGLLYLVLECHERLVALDPDTQETVRAVTGWTQSKECALGQVEIRDQWAVLGMHAEENNGLVTERVWLRGVTTRRNALLLDFYHESNAARERIAPAPGVCFDADLVYFAGASPLRALIKTQRGTPGQFQLPQGHESIQDALQEYRSAIACNAWLPQFPLLLQSVVPVCRHGAEVPFVLVDRNRRTLPVDTRFQGTWRLMSLSGGRPITVFAEWNGETALPLNAFADAAEEKASQ